MAKNSRNIEVLSGGVRIETDVTGPYRFVRLEQPRLALS